MESTSGRANWALSTLMFAVLLGGCFTVRPFSFPDYPAAVKAHVQANFQVQLEKLRQEGVPQSIEEAKRWFPVPQSGENAFEVYQKALSAVTLPGQLALFAEAQAISDFHYPIDWESLNDPLSGALSIELDYMGDMRNMARLLSDATVGAAALGDAEATTDALVSAFGLIRHTGSLYFILPQLTRAACLGITMESLEHSLNSIEFGDSQLQRIEEAMRAAERPDALARTWYVEKVVYDAEDPFAVTPNLGMLIAFYRYTALFRVAHTMIGAERFRLAHGRAPENLQELVPEFLDVVPMDPFAEEPIHYVLESGRFIVHSVGPDGTPDPKIASYGPTDYPRDEVFMVVAFDKIPTKALSKRRRESKPVDNGHSSEESGAAQAVAKIIQERIDPNGLVVSILRFELGLLDGGVAVLCNKRWSQPSEAEVNMDAAFWVKDETVYTVNDQARTLAPRQEAAPAAITYNRVRAVVR